MRRIFFALASTALIASSGGAQDLPKSRVRVSLVGLEGPLHGVEIAYADGSGARIDLSLVDGETRTLRIPLPVPAGAEDAEPRIEVDGSGSARVLPSEGVGAISASKLLADMLQAGAKLPMSVRQRPLPPPPAARGPSAPPAAWLLACAGFALALRLRARGALALLAGLVGGGAALGVSAAQDRVQHELYLLDGSSDSPLCLSIRAASGRLTLQGAIYALWIETRPSATPLVLLVREGARDLELALESRSAIYQLEASSIGQTLTRSGPNGFANFERVWVREPDGAWSQRGPWKQGDTLPPAEPGESQPPSWIQPALPLGTGILIAEEPRRPSEVGDEPAECWVRLVGF